MFPFGERIFDQMSHPLPPLLRHAVQRSTPFLLRFHFDNFCGVMPGAFGPWGSSKIGHFVKPLTRSCRILFVNAIESACSRFWCVITINPGMGSAPPDKRRRRPSGRHDFPARIDFRPRICSLAFARLASRSSLDNSLDLSVTGDVR